MGNPVQHKRGQTTLEKLVSSVVIASTVFVSGSSPGCNNASQEKAFVPNGPTSVVGPFTIHYAASMDAHDQTWALDAINQHWQMYNAVFGAPYNAPRRHMYLYEVPLLNYTPWGVNQMGWAEVASGDVHLAAGAGLTFPDAMHQFEHSFYYPYEIYDQYPNPQHWSDIKVFADVVVSMLKQQSRLPP